jgi:hypothetical protein
MTWNEGEARESPKPPEPLTLNDARGNQILDFPPMDWGNGGSDHKDAPVTNAEAGKIDLLDFAPMSWK